MFSMNSTSLVREGGVQSGGDRSQQDKYQAHGQAGPAQPPGRVGAAPKAAPANIRNHVREFLLSTVAPPLFTLLNGASGACVFGGAASRQRVDN